jgi:hypothetical protein
MYNQDAAHERQPFYLTTGFLFWGILFLSLLPWFFIHVQQATNSDVLWLSEALRRVLAGGRLTDVAYEQNPPFNMLLYILPVLADKLIRLPLHYGLFFQTTLIVAAGAAATYSILSKWPVLKNGETSIIVAGFILAETLGTLFYYSERDHILSAFIFPFVLLQISLTYRFPYPEKIKWPVFIFGAFLILIKPHNGLLPSLILVHRVWERRNLSVLKDADFLSLAGCTLVYIVMTCVLFPDYVSIILPDALRFYVPMGGLGAVFTLSAAFFTVIFITAIAVYLLPFSPVSKNIIYFLLAAVFINLISFMAQGKGLYYQLLPVTVFLAPALYFTLYNFALMLAKPAAASIGSLIIVIGLTYLYVPMLPHFARHNDYMDLPVSKILLEECPKHKQCKFFMFSRDMGVIQETAHYTGLYSSSRFSSLWFAPVLVKDQKDLRTGHPSQLTRKEIDRSYNRFSNMIAEDFSTQKPDVVVLWTGTSLFDGKNFIDYFSGNENFRKEWKHYRKTRSVKVDLNKYYRGAIPSGQNILQYDVYRRNLP